MEVSSTDHLSKEEIKQIRKMISEKLFHELFGPEIRKMLENLAKQKNDSSEMQME